MPDRIDGDLDDRQTAVRLHHRAVDGEPPASERLLELGQIEAGARHGDAWSDVDAFGYLLAERLHHRVSPGIDRDDLGGAHPLREGADGGCGIRIGEIGALDLFLSSSGWDLWQALGASVERTSDRLLRWWAEPFSAKAVLSTATP